MNQNDSALFYLKPILAQLEENSQPNKELLMRVQLGIGKALEQKNDNIGALQYLHPLQEISKITQQWEIYVESCLILARLFNEMQQEKAAKQYIDNAHTVISRHQFTRFVPELSMLKVNWHSSFGYPDSVLYYMDVILKAINLEGSNPRLQADYYTLMGLKHKDTNIKLAISYFKKAVSFAKSYRDYERLAELYQDISYQYEHMEDHANFHQYQDSIFYAGYQAIANGQLNSKAFVLAYFRKYIYYRERGQLDSAMFFIKKQINEERILLEQQESFQVAELDIKYNYEKQANQLTLQEEQIKTNQKIGLLLLGIILLTFLSLALLIQNYRKQKQTNQQLEEQSEQLASLDKMKSRFFANVSHELRTPLTLILGSTNSLLKEKYILREHQQLLEIAENSGNQLHQLINEILNLRKLELGKLAVFTQATPLYAFFNRYCTQFESLAQSKTIDYSFDIQIEQDLIGELDQEKCRQVLYNLLSNAFKFTPDNEQISLEVKVENEILQLTITDTGEGIHPDDIGQIFDRYFQTNHPEKPIEGGTGIGLALCKEYVQLFGGKIEVDSLLGKGTTFKLSFPIVLLKEDFPIVKAEQIAIDDLSENANSLMLQEVKTESTRQEKPQILVVEDHPNLAKYLKYILSKKYEVTLRENGQKAWDYLSAGSNGQQSVDCKLILSDLMMPVMDGYQLLEKLKSNDATRHLPVIMLTARADVKDKLKALRIGVDDYLLKPFEEEELLVRIENLLTNQNIRQQSQSDFKLEKEIPLISQEDQKWLVSFENFVRKNLQNDLLSVPMLAKEFAMSESTLLRQLKRLTSLTPAKYIQEVRLEEARRLLENNIYNSIRQVAYKTGYSDPAIFSKAFKRKYGKTPSKFINY